MRTAGWLENGIEGRHVLMGLIVFFGVMLFANTILVYYAVGTFSGGDRHDPYRSGLRYNETIEADKRQAALGWEAALAYDDVKGRLTLRVVDETEQPVAGLALDARLSRPATDKEDRAVDFREVEPGVYAADVALAPGGWVFSLSSSGTAGNDPIFRLKQRLFVAERP